MPGLLKRGGKLISKACQCNAVIVSAGDVRVMVSDTGVSIMSGNTKMTISDAGVSISGNLKVDGNISSTGMITP